MKNEDPQIAAQSVKITLPEGNRLADLHGISNDLRACRDYILLFNSISLLKPSFLNHQLIDCTITTIFVRYGRCFGTGVRSKTQQELKGIMNADDLKTHQLVVDFRNKHFAHSVNRCESPEINVWLQIGSDERMVTSVNAASTNMIAPHPLVLTNLLVLIDKLHAWVRSEEAVESQKLFALVKERFSLDELYSLLGVNNSQPIRVKDVAKSRR